jgi:cytochrome c
MRHGMTAGAIALIALATASADAALTGDPGRGALVYERCMGCHSIDYDRVGPHHRGLFGRPAGSVADFDYSEAMKRSGIVWGEATLDKFLSGPRAFVPGTRMGFAGIPDDQERADVIAYLKEATRPK